MASSGSMKGDDEIEKKSVVNHYLNSVMAPMKTLSFKEGVLLVEDVKAPKTEGSLEEKYAYTLSQVDRFQALMWDVENQNCKYEDRFKKIAEAALTKWNDPPISFYNGRPYPWKLKEWETHYDGNDATEEGPATTI